MLPAASFCQQADTMSAYKFTPRGHLDHLQKPALIRDDKIKWLDIGNNEDDSDSE